MKNKKNTSISDPSLALSERIYNTVLRTGITGITDEAIARLLKTDARSVQRARHTSLGTNSRVAATKMRRKTSAGGLATVWVSDRIVDWAATTGRANYRSKRI